jgi:hypothetical protein
MHPNEIVGQMVLGNVVKTFCIMALEIFENTIVGCKNICGG